MSVFAAGLALAAASPAAADTTQQPPKTETVQVNFPNYRWSSYSSKYWTSEGSTCGFWGCRPNFATTTHSDRSVYWNMGNVQGVFTFARALAEHVHPDQLPTTGRVLWRIYEKRTSHDKFRLVQTFRPPPQNGRSGWWTYSDNPIVLDGEVRIRATGLENGKRIAVQAVRLNHVDVLPEHKELAIDMCADGDERLKERISSIATWAGVAVSVLAAIWVPGIGHAALAATLKAAGVAAGIASAVASELLRYIGDRNETKEGYCGEFHARWWWQGYSKFSDDIAALSITPPAGNCYPTFGVTYCPTRRS